MAKEETSMHYASRTTVYMALLFGAIGLAFLYAYIGLALPDWSSRVLWWGILSIGIAFFSLIIKTVVDDMIADENKKN